MKFFANAISAIIGAGLVCLGVALYRHDWGDWLAMALMLLLFGGSIRIGIYAESKE